jgi:predicted DNA-binding WGR domain protein
MGKKSVSKGHILDDYCKYKDAILIDNNGMIYSCMLNQTDLKTNKNKFYTMQLIKTSSSHIHYIRYGRIGEPGKTSYDTFSTKNDSIQSFERQFKLKTGNNWSDKKNFVKKSGKYFLSDVSYEEELKNIEDDSTKNTNIPVSKLPTKVYDLIKMISDVDMMTNALIDLKIDPKKMPLGKITKSQINSAKNLLDKIETKLKEVTIIGKDNDKTDSEELLLLVDDEVMTLCSSYYTKIPFMCGRNKPPIINNLTIINDYRNILSELENIVVGIEIVKSVGLNENPVDSIYNNINTIIKPMRRNTKVWKEIDAYITNTHGPTHNCKVRLVDVFEIVQCNKQERFDSHCQNIGNRKLLFHGTPQSCVLSIFKNDFYLDPTKLNDPNVVIAGKMFGQGIYFADMASKSFNYTRAQNTNNKGCLILGEIALGKESTRTNADYRITPSSLKKEGMDSIKALGRWGPGSTSDINGVQIPNGKTIDLTKNPNLRYNEYIVYNVDQICIKYLTVVENIGGNGGY